MNIVTKTIRALRQRSQQNPAMDYLNESVSIHDLERRQREIDSGLFNQRRQIF